MSLIYIPTISNYQLNQAQFHTISSAASAGFSIGEILEAGVVEKLSDRRILITLKGVNLSADSEVTLNAGDKIRIKVESLHPQVILRILERGNLEEFKVADYLRWHRSNPDAISHMITEAVMQFNTGNLVKIIRYLPEEDFQKIFKILKSLFLSPETKGNEYIKDYLGKLGMLTESQLRQVLEGKSGIGEGCFDPQNLKSLLMKISEDLHSLLAGKGSFAHEDGILLNNLSKYLDSSIKTIEAHQIINVILQESESKYLFQIPILFQDGIRKGDIFVEYDRNSRGERDKSQYRVIFFLSMDILGDMIIEARLKGDRIDCLIKCLDQEVCDFISSFLEELRNSLSAMGCQIDTVKCVAGGDLAKEKIDYYQDRVLYAGDVIDLFA